MKKSEIAFIVDIREGQVDITWSGFMNGKCVWLTFHNNSPALHEAIMNEDIARIMELWDEELH